MVENEDFREGYSNFEKRAGLLLWDIDAANLSKNVKIRILNNIRRSINRLADKLYEEDDPLKYTE